MNHPTSFYNIFSNGSHSMLAVVCAVGIIVVFMVVHITKAAETDTIAATVSATNLDVSVSPGSITYGSVALNTATSTAGNGFTQTATNNGSDAQLNVRSSAATNGEAWNIGTSPGSDIYTHEVSTTTGSTYMVFQANDEYLTASTTFSSLTSGDLDFRLTTPSDSTDFVEKSITLTVQVVAP